MNVVCKSTNKAEVNLLGPEAIRRQVTNTSTRTAPSIETRLRALNNLSSQAVAEYQQAPCVSFDLGGPNATATYEKLRYTSYLQTQ